MTSGNLITLALIIAFGYMMFRGGGCCGGHGGHHNQEKDDSTGTVERESVENKE